MTLRASKPAFNVREKLTELGRRFGLKGSELAAAETVQEARDLVSAGRKNLVINGDFTVAQRATTSTINSATTAIRTVDRFRTKYFGSGWGSSHSTESQSTDAPPGHSYSYKILTNVVQSYSSSLGSWIQYPFEGNQLLSLKTKDLGYKAFTVSFWVKSNKTGYVTWSIETSGQGHGFSTAVQINSANTWEYKVVTVPASPPSQLSEAEFRSVDNELNMKWGLGSNGSWLVGTDDSWQPIATNRGVLSPLQTNFQAAVNDYLSIGGVQLEVGKNATEFEHRSYGEELALCQRYYLEKSIGYGRLAHFRTSALMLSMFDLPVVMRSSASASVTATNINAWAYNDGNGITVSSVNASGTGVGGSTANVMFNVTANGSANSQVFYYGGGVIQIDAELT